jgi:hypothetical protein
MMGMTGFSKGENDKKAFSILKTAKENLLLT